MRHRWMIGLAVLLGVCIGGCGTSSPPLAGGKPVQYWLDALRSPDAKLRKKAAFKLGNVGTADARALSALTAALGDSDASVRCEVIFALVKFGPAARDMGPMLTDMQRRDPDARVRTYAAKAAEKIR
jgi:HEAT repeat protein